MDDLISRQAAIDALDRIFDRCEEIEAHLPEGDPDRTGYKMYPDYMTLWKYLRQLPPAQPEPLQPWEVLAAQAVLSHPAEPKRGRWIGKYPITSVCSECGFLIHDSKVKAFAYCPNCGADMREKGENSESN